MSGIIGDVLKNVAIGGAVRAIPSKIAKPIVKLGQKIKYGVIGKGIKRGTDPIVKGVKHAILKVKGRVRAIPKAYKKAKEGYAGAIAKHETRKQHAKLYKANVGDPYALPGLKQLKPTKESIKKVAKMETKFGRLSKAIHHGKKALKAGFKESDRKALDTLFHWVDKRDAKYIDGKRLYKESQKVIPKSLVEKLGGWAGSTLSWFADPQERAKDAVVGKLATVLGGMVAGGAVAGGGAYVGAKMAQKNKKKGQK